MITLIENHLKWIYSLICSSDISENYDSLVKNNLVFVIKEFKKLYYLSRNAFYI